MYPTKEDFEKEAERVLVFNQAPDIKFVPIGSVWTHTNGVEYEIILIANEFSENVRYPITVIYQGLENAKIWSRTLSDWHRSMKFKKFKNQKTF